MYKNEEWLRQKIEIEGLTQKQVAELCGTQHYNIRHWASKFNIDRPSSTKSKSNMENSKKCRDKEWLYHQFITLDKSYDQISSEFNLGKTTIARWVKKHGLVKETLPQHRRENSNPPIEVSCERCGKKTWQKHAKVINGYGRYCSQSCAAKDALESGLSEKLNEGLTRWRNSEEGKEFMVAHGVKVMTNSDRNRRTSIEKKMAEELSNREIKYIEQYNLGNKFALDFFLPEYNLVIECDGDYWHRRPDVIKRDNAKNAYIKACGFPLFRFWESEINTDVEACVDLVMAEINTKEAQ